MGVLDRRRLSRMQDSLALDRFLLDCLFAICYQLLQQLQSGFPLLGCLLAKKLVGHTFQGECPHDLNKEGKKMAVTGAAFKFTKQLRYPRVLRTPVASSSRCCFLDMRS